HGTEADRDALLATLHEAGFLCRPIWEPMHRLPMFTACPRGALPVTESFAARVVNIPSSAHLATSDIQKEITSADASADAWAMSLPRLIRTLRYLRPSQIGRLALHRCAYAGKARRAAPNAISSTIRGDLLVRLILHCVTPRQAWRNQHMRRTSEVFYRADLESFLSPSHLPARPVHQS
ncbi:MAG: DegT/DnrJ/EryC1/StrS family aminotransferase, partial [Planctomycetes bacterium]|nr:DegT/DnrJ/EryC1/StrS family aminotransferase [Planctomycetota bacterium]